MFEVNWIPAVFLLSIAVLTTAAGQNNNPQLFIYKNKQITPFGNCKSSPLVAGVKTFAFAHGWRETYKVKYYTVIADLIIAKEGNVNIIFIDWSGVAGDIEYFPIKGNMPKVAQSIANQLANCQSKIDFKLLTMIGFSLGGQLFGCIGNIFKEKNLPLYKIEALDPAGIGYYNQNFLYDKSAKIVSCLHTSLFGTQQRSGTRDIFVNPPISNTQPGCKNYNSNSLGDLLNLLISIFSNETATGIGCSHEVAVEIYIRAFLSDEFVCADSQEDSTRTMVYSYKTPDDVTGSWILKTGSITPDNV